MSLDPTISLDTNIDEGYVEITVHQGTTQPDSYEVQYSYDLGQTWGYVRFAENLGYDSQQTIIRDYESLSNRTTLYRAKAIEGINESNWSPVMGAVLQVDQWWLKDPYNSNNSMKFAAAGDSFDITESEDSAEFNPLGRKHLIIVSDVMRGERLDNIRLTTLGWAEYEKFKYLRRAQRVLLLQAPFRKQWYVRLGKQLDEKVISTTDEYRELSISAIEQQRP